MKDLITQEIGSFRKPEYLSNVFRKISGEELHQLKKKALKETLEVFDRTGLENMGVGGEMYRWEMYEHLAAGLAGIEFYGMVRSFDNRYFRKGSAVSDLRKIGNVHLEELGDVMALTRKAIKVPITGPYTMMDWSFDDYYQSREKLAMKYAELINQEIKELRDFWHSRHNSVMEIQIDEPALTTRPSEMDIGVESLNASMEGISGCEFSLHVCYSTDYRMLYRRIPDLNFHGYNLEFANRAPVDPSTGQQDITAFETVRDFAEVSSDRFLGLGVNDVHIDYVESPQQIADRIETSLKHIDASRLRINPDCGLRTRSREVGEKKLASMVKGRDLARERLGI
jgi:5-methyltetrahydropteroyltriglutamate--homocysteine methyltransferase